MTSIPPPPPDTAVRRKRTLTVADVAKLRGTTREAARLWLYRHAAKHLRDGRRGLVISMRAYVLLQQAHSIGDLVKRIETLEENLALMDRRVTAHANALSRSGAL
jgi:hypothetical protein